MSLWQTALVSALAGMITGWITDRREQKITRQLERERLWRKKLLEKCDQSYTYSDGTTATENSYEPHRRTFRQ